MVLNLCFFTSTVSISQQNIHLLNKLLDQLRIMINCACWGHPLGSTQLWENHLNTINRIVEIANSIHIREVNFYFDEISFQSKISTI